MLPPLDIDGCSDANTRAQGPDCLDSNQPPSAVYIVRTLATGGTVEYRAHCAPNTTLAELRVILEDDEDEIMGSGDRFYQGKYCVGKGAEAQTKWRDILEVIRA